jgi:uncharacterized protein (DUF924 family)
MSDSLDMAQSQIILDFWFGKPDEEEYGKPRQVWFRKNSAFDAVVRSRFLSTYQQAAPGEFDDWKATPAGCLALIILLDQFPRNLFRNQPQAFATDRQALSLAEYAVDRGFDRELLPVQRWFIYLPFEHSENLDHQQRCVELFAQLEGNRDNAAAIDSALRHQEIIERFGRFPHRNKILGRESTPEEEEFLQQSGSSF